MLDVVFIVNDSKRKVTKHFESEYMCRKFVNKLRHSKKLTLINYPIFS